MNLVFPSSPFFSSSFYYRPWPTRSRLISSLDSSSAPGSPLLGWSGSETESVGVGVNKSLCRHNCLSWDFFFKPHDKAHTHTREPLSLSSSSCVYTTRKKQLGWARPFQLGRVEQYYASLFLFCSLFSLLAPQERVECIQMESFVCTQQRTESPSDTSQCLHHIGLYSTVN